MYTLLKRSICLQLPTPCVGNALVGECKIYLFTSVMCLCYRPFLLVKSATLTTFEYTGYDVKVVLCQLFFGIAKLSGGLLYLGV